MLSTTCLIIVFYVCFYSATRDLMKLVVTKVDHAWLPFCIPLHTTHVRFRMRPCSFNQIVAYCWGTSSRTAIRWADVLKIWHFMIGAMLLATENLQSIVQERAYGFVPNLFTCVLYTNCCLHNCVHIVFLFYCVSH